MKDIRDVIRENSLGLREYVNDSEELFLEQNSQIDEGLKDIIANLKKKFKQVWDYLTGLVAKVSGSYWLAVDDSGELLPAISPLTAGQAYADGNINKVSTVVVMGRKGRKITGCTTKKQDAKALYGSGNSIAYWKRMIGESVDADKNQEIIQEYFTKYYGEEGWKEIQEKTKETKQILNEVKLQNSDPQAKYNVVDTPALKARIKMAFKNKKLSRLLIWGAPGIGKTAILMSVLDELPDGNEYNLVVKTLSNETPDNFTLPKYVEINGQEKATDVPKTWLPVYKPTPDEAQNQILDDACGKGLLFIDELSRATPQVLNVILPLINEGQFNGYKIGSGWAIIVASNRAEDELSGQAEIGNALGNRFAQLYYEPTVNTWQEWAKKQNYISPLLLQWLSLPSGESHSGAKYFYMDPNETAEDAGITKIMCTPRSWTNAMRELAEYSNTGTLEGFTIFDIPREILAMTLNEYVPAEAVDSFLAFLHVVSKVGNFDAVVNDIWKNGGKNFKVSPKDLGLVALPLSQIVVTSHQNSLPTSKEYENLCDWLVAQDSSQLASYVLDIVKNTFTGMLKSEKFQLGVFIWHKKLKADPDLKTEQGRKVYTQIYSEFMNRWGLKSLDDFPDWLPGHMKLVKKFGQDFELKIDGKDALG